MPKKRKKPLRYFYYDGKPHKKIHISLANDLITAWNYTDAKMERYVYSDVRRNGRKAYSTREVSELLGRSRLRIGIAISEGHIKAPPRAYTIDEKRVPQGYLWSEKDVIAAHDYFLTVHRGRPRKDGRITTGPGLPTLRELRDKMRHGTVLGYQDEDGNFIPTWEQHRL